MSVRRQGWAAVVVLAWSASAGAGELENGSRLQGDVVDEVAVLRSAGGPVEVSGPDKVRTQGSVSAAPEEGGTSSVSRTSGPSAAMGREGGRWLEVVSDSALLKDAFAAASLVGRVARGQQVMLVDYIDRRLRILNTLVLDGGYWLKVRVADGREGWVPADTVREAR